MAEINKNNIKQFFQGNLRMFANSLSKFTRSYIGLEKHIQEQVYYRSTKCQDCFQEKKCLYCGCSVPGKWFADDQCKGKRWPAMMLKAEDWERYKQENNIEIQLNDIYNNS